MQKAASHHLIHQHSKQNQTRERMIGAEMFVSRCARGKSVAANGSLCLWKLLHFRNGMAEVTNRNFFAIEPFRQR